MLDDKVLDDHAERIRRDGFTVLERLVAPSIVASLVASLDRLERDKGFGYAKTSFEGHRTIRINTLPDHL